MIQSRSFECPHCNNMMGAALHDDNKMGLSYVIPLKCPSCRGRMNKGLRDGEFVITQDLHNSVLVHPVTYDLYYVDNSGTIAHEENVTFNVYADPQDLYKELYDKYYANTPTSNSLTGGVYQPTNAPSPQSTNGVVPPVVLDRIRTTLPNSVGLEYDELLMSCPFCKKDQRLISWSTQDELKNGIQTGRADSVSCSACDKKMNLDKNGIQAGSSLASLVGVHFIKIGYGAIRFYDNNGNSQFMIPDSFGYFKNPTVMSYTDVLFLVNLYLQRVGAPTLSNAQYKYNIQPNGSITANFVPPKDHTGTFSCPETYKDDIRYTDIIKSGPKTNDHNETCYFCGGRTESMGFTGRYCPKCKK